jgi:hypothetical protein
MRYYKKGERYRKYLEALAAGTFHGMLSPEQAYQAHYDFDKLWRDFVLMQKIRYKKQRQIEQRAWGKGEQLPVHDHQGSAQTDEQYWEVAYENAQRRTHG